MRQSDHYPSDQERQDDRPPGQGTEPVRGAAKRLPHGSQLSGGHLLTPERDRWAAGTATRTPAGARSLGPAWQVPRVVVGVVVTAVICGVLLRLFSASPLWLDEALSVNIAALPVPELLSALRRDGSPPLYYLILHGWTEAFGTSAFAVRSLSSCLALLALPAAYRAGRLFGGEATGRVALCLVATNPFLIRYATETRMYALVVLLACLGGIAARRAWLRPDRGRLAQLAVCSGLLMLTHYWTFFLLAALGLVLAGCAILGRHRSTARRLLAAEVLGGLLFLPWSGGFLHQLRHTGTPWAPPPDLEVVTTTLQAWSGGSAVAATVMVVLVAVLTAVAVLPPQWAQRVPGPAGGLIRRAGPGPTGWALVATSLGALLIAIAVSNLSGSGFAPRYTAAFVVPALLVVAMGICRLERRAGALVLVIVTVLGAGNAVHGVLTDDRTQAGETAALLKASVAPGDAIVYCPDQLGPAVSRLLPDGVNQFVYPTLKAPQLIDWTDYGRRNAAASPTALAHRISQRVPGAVWLVTKGGYLTFGDDCEQLASALTALGRDRTRVQRADVDFFENENVIRFAAPRGSAAVLSGDPTGASGTLFR